MLVLRVLHVLRVLAVLAVLAEGLLGVGLAGLTLVAPKSMDEDIIQCGAPKIAKLVNITTI
jgi:hypothetical protein